MNVDKAKTIAVNVAGAGCALYGFVRLAPYITGIAVFVGTLSAMAWFADVNYRDIQEKRKERMEERMKAIDADEIIPPTRSRRSSSSNETITLDMNQEREMQRLKVREANARAELSKVRSNMKTIENNIKIRDYAHPEYEEDHS